MDLMWLASYRGKEEDGEEEVVVEVHFVSRLKLVVLARPPNATDWSQTAENLQCSKKEKSSECSCSVE